MTNLDSILKSQDFPLPTKVRLVKDVKTMVFPVVMYGCKSWTIKKTEHQKTDTFKLWCWRRFLRVIWTAGRSNQSILGGNAPWIFIGRTDAEAEALILWPPDSKSLIGKDPDAGKDWGQVEKGVTEDEIVGWHHQLNGHDWANSGSWWRTGKPGLLQFMGSQRVRHGWVTEQQQRVVLLHAAYLDRKQQRTRA